MHYHEMYMYERNSMSYHINIEQGQYEYIWSHLVNYGLEESNG